MSINRVSLCSYTIWFRGAWAAVPAGRREVWQLYHLVQKDTEKGPFRDQEKDVNLSTRFARRGSYGRQQDLRRQLDG
jgi:hypothetical protein